MSRDGGWDPRVADWGEAPSCIRVSTAQSPGRTLTRTEEISSLTSAVTGILGRSGLAAKRLEPLDH